jgi:glutathione S-transferase
MRRTEIGERSLRRRAIRGGFRTLTGRDQIPARYALGRTALAMLEEHLADRSFVVGDQCSIADLSNFAYTHVAEDAGYRLGDYPAVGAWLDRVRAEPRFVDDLQPYPDNARPGAGRSIYDE